MFKTFYNYPFLKGEYMLFEWLSDPTQWLALATLSVLEIVLGIDNIIFLSVIVSRLPESMRQRARILGLTLAMVTRILLLGFIFVLAHLNNPLFFVKDFGVSLRDIVLFLGGLFLLYKSTTEIYAMTQGDGKQSEPKVVDNFFLVLVQIALLDIVFSLDSVITAVGMVENVVVMVLAIVIAIGVMMLAAKSISEFIESNPSLKVLAFSFLILIGAALVADSLHFHIPKGYLYFAIAFSLGVEMINLWIQKRKG